MKRYTFRKQKSRDGIFQTWEYDYESVEAKSFEEFDKDENSMYLDLISRGFRLFTITKS
jgi:hypothetical protein